jgi:hypothetical protein
LAEELGEKGENGGVMGELLVQGDDGGCEFVGCNKTINSTDSKMYTYNQLIHYFNQVRVK